MSGGWTFKNIVAGQAEVEIRGRVVGCVYRSPRTGIWQAEWRGGPDGYGARTVGSAETRDGAAHALLVESRRLVNVL